MIFTDVQKMARLMPGAQKASEVMKSDMEAVAKYYCKDPTDYWIFYSTVLEVLVANLINDMDPSGRDIEKHLADSIKRIQNGTRKMRETFPR